MKSVGGLTSLGVDDARLTRRRLLAAGAGLLGSATLSSRSARASDSLIPVKIGRLKQLQNAPLAHMADLARSYHIDLALVEFQRYSDMHVAIGNGSIDFGVVGPGDVVLGLTQGNNRVVVVGGLVKGADFMAAGATVPQLTWAQLSRGDYTVATLGAGIGWLKAVATIASQGYDFGKFKTVKLSGGGPDLQLALKRNDAQVAILTDPFVAIGAVAGFARYADELDINNSPIGSQNGLFATNKNWLERTNDIDQVMKLYVAAVTELENDTEKWKRVYQSYTGLPDDVARSSLQRCHLDIGFSDVSLTALGHYLYEQGLAPRDIDESAVAAAYNYGPLSRAIGRSPADLGKGKPDPRFAVRASG